MGATITEDKAIVAGVRSITHRGVATTGDGGSFQLVRAAKVTLQFIDNSGGAAFTANLQASNNGTTFANVPTAVSSTQAGLKSVPRDGLGFRHYRISHTGGVGTTDFNCIVIAHEGGV